MAKKKKDKFATVIARKPQEASTTILDSKKVREAAEKYRLWQEKQILENIIVEKDGKEFEWKLQKDGSYGLEPIIKGR